MAEIVEKHMERSMRDFEIIRNLNILEETEISQLIKKREHFAYMLAKQTKVLKYYLEYIRFERSLLTLIAEHNRQKSSTQHMHLEQSLLRRINDLYVQAIERFADVEQLWDDYILFCVQTKYDLSDIAKIMSNMLQFHGGKVTAWFKCIKWNRLANPEVSHVKAIAMKALQRHPTSVRLNAELMDITLSQLQIECVNDDDDDDDDANANELVLQQASVVYDNGYAQLPTIEFCLAMLETVSSFAHTEQLLDTIVTQMRASFAKDPRLWHILALAKLNGGRISTTSLEHGVARDACRTEIEDCVAVYKAAVSNLNDKALWTYYLNTMLVINTSHNTNALGSLRRRSLGQAFQLAEEANQLTADLYVQYFDIMKAVGTDDTVLSKVMQRAMSAYPKSQNVWLWCMQHHIAHKDAKEARAIFTHCRQTMERNDETAIAVWEQYLAFLKSNEQSQREIEQLYAMIVAEIHDNFNHLKASYLDWCMQTNGIAHARQSYAQTCASAKPSLAMHVRMAELEEQQPVPDLRSWRKCLQMATNLHGVDSVSVWLRYILFETRYGDAIVASQLSGKAVKMLKPELVERFMAENKQNFVV